MPSHPHHSQPFTAGHPGHPTTPMNEPQPGATTPQIQKVVFRASRRKVPEITAVLIGQLFSHDTPLTVWDPQGGHGGASYGWYRSTRPAKPAEYAAELRTLQRIYAPEYKIEVRQKLS